MQEVWADTIVEESGLTRNISVLRRTLGESPDQHQYIVTVPGRGYCFVAGVRELLDEPQDLIVEKRTRSRIVTEEEVEAEIEGAMEGQRDGEIEREEKKIFSTAPAAIATTAARPLGHLPLGRRAAVWMIAVPLLALALVIVYWGKMRWSPSTATSAAPKSIAVLPFKPLVAESRDEYLQMGMADVLITRLSNLNQILVRPTSAVYKYTNLEQDPAAAGRELKVEAVLEGKLQRLGDRLRVTAHLVNVSDGRTLWAEKFDEQFTDIFRVQDTLAEKLAAALALHLTGEEKQLLTRRYTENAEAYQLYVKGHYYWNMRTDETYRKAIEYFQQAKDKDPDYALAYSGLADCYSFMSSQSVMSPSEGMPLAKEAATKALALDETLAEAHTSLAYVKLYYDWDWKGAEQEYRRAIQLNSSYPTPHHGYGYLLISSGRTAEAFAEIQKAEELDPRSLLINTDHGEFFYFTHQPVQAIAQFKKALALDPTFVRAHFLLGRAYVQNGQCAEAMNEFQKARSLVAGSMEMLGAVGQGYAWCGTRAQAQQVLEQLQEMAKQRYVSPHWFAATYAALGDKERAFEWLNKAFERRFGPLIYLKVNPIWDPLRSDPRFADFVRRVSLAP